MATVALTIWRPPFVAEFDLRIYDALADTEARADVTSRVAIVAIDEASLATLGQWPWPRDVVARLAVRLQRMGATAIAFDVLFPESDRASASSDGTLANAFRDAPAVASYAFTFAAQQAGEPCAPPPLSLVQRQQGDDAPDTGLFHASGVVCSLNILAEAAAAAGFINVGADADGVLRRSALLVSYHNRLYPSLALAAVRRATTAPRLVLERRDDDSLALSVGDLTIPLDAQGRMLIRYLRGPERPVQLSAAAVLDGRVPAKAIAGRVVFVGATALGLGDVVVTPVDRAQPGIEVHAAMASSLLGGQVNARPQHALLYELFAAVLAGLGVIAVGQAAGMIAAIATGVATGALLWFAARLLLNGSGLFLSPLYGIAALAIGIALRAGVTLVRDRRRGDDEQRRRANAQRLIVQALASLTETRDLSTGGHSRRTEEYTRVLATELARTPAYRKELTPERIDLIATLAALHDIGKVGVSDAVLRKPGALTADEQREMRRHPGIGHESLLKAEAGADVHDDEVLAVAKEIVHTHHERWDGTGYPRGLRGAEIPLAGRLVSLVDSYDAMVTTRAYRDALPAAEVAEIIVSGRGHSFDPDIVDAFVLVQDQFRRLAEHEPPETPLHQPTGI